MGEDERVRFEEMEKRLAAADKRFDDMRWFVGGGTGVFAIFISAFTIFLGLNLSSEKASIRDFVQDAKTQLGLLAPNADIKILGTNGAPLDGQEMVATFRSQKENNETKIWLQVRHFMRNDGTGPSGPIWVKLYTPSQVVLDSPSTDESRYKYEGVVDPASLHPDEQPGGFSQAWYYNFFLPEGKPPTGKYDVLLKVYYGSAKAQVSHARFTLDVP